MDISARFSLSLRLHAGVVLLAAISVGCGGPQSDVSGLAEAGATAEPARAGPAPGNPPRALRGIPDVRCKPRLNGIDNCTSQHFDVSGSELACVDGEAAFGATNDAVALRSAPGRETADVVARLHPGQLLCIQYTADSRLGGEGWHYVAAIPRELVSACRSNPLCQPTPPPEWSSTKPASPCAVGADKRYSAGCASGWVPNSGVTTYSMGMSKPAAATVRGEKAEPPPSSDVTVYSRVDMAGGKCIAGARIDDLGRQTAIVLGLRADGSRWVTKVPRDPDFHQSRATHCACSVEACYVAIATDTQSAQTLSQTLLSVARLSSDTGAITETRLIKTLPGANDVYTAWLDPGQSMFSIRHGQLQLRGQWRSHGEQDAHRFQLTLPLF